MQFSVSVYSSLDMKDISKMICHLKFIFAWILLIPQLIGNVFIRDFDRILLVFTFPFGFILYQVPYFILTAADCCAF